jgi:hypothetical protein
MTDARDEVRGRSAEAEHARQVALLDGETVNAYREAAIELRGNLRRAAIALQECKNKDLAFDCWLFSLGEYGLVGCHEEIDLARRHRCGKANVSRLVKILERCLGLKSALRSAEAVNNMRNERKGQLE